jgi:hypothetical protein
MAYCFSPTSDLIWVMSELWANDDRSSYDNHPTSSPSLGKKQVFSWRNVNKSWSRSGGGIGLSENIKAQGVMLSNGFIPSKSESKTLFLLILHIL